MSTHFHEIFSYNLIDMSNPYYLFSRMKVIVPPAQNDRDEKARKENIIYLFEMEDGVSMSSFGIECAMMASMPLEICERARDVHNCFVNRKVNLEVHNHLHGNPKLEVSHSE